MTNSLASNNIPRVSVVLPTYNQAEYLPRALDAVFNQTWKDYELIVVNDGSTDKTSQILKEYQKQNKFTVIDKENKKLPEALNTGFHRAKGDYLTWTSSDNVMLPDMLKVLVHNLDSYPEVGLVYADWEYIDEHDNVIAAVETYEYDRLLLLRANFVYACFMYRRACQEKVGLYDPEYIYAEDYEYWIRISRFFNMMRVPRILYRYRVHSTSLSKYVTQIQQEKRPRRNHLAVKLRSNRFDWYLSKIKWEWLHLRLGYDPMLNLKPYWNDANE